MSDILFAPPDPTPPSLNRSKPAACVKFNSPKDESWCAKAASSCSHQMTESHRSSADTLLTGPSPPFCRAARLTRQTSTSLRPVLAFHQHSLPHRIQHHLFDRLPPSPAPTSSLVAHCSHLAVRYGCEGGVADAAVVSPSFSSFTYVFLSSARPACELMHVYESLCEPARL